MNLLLFLYHVAIFYAELVRVRGNLQLHKLMTVEERFETFGISDGKVPTFELVRIAHSIRSNGTKKCVNFYAFDRNMELKLQKKNMLLFSKQTPIWTASVMNRKIKYTPVPTEALHNALEFYEDPNNMAGVGIKDDGHGNLEFAGYIQDHLILKKVPPRLHEIWSDLFNKSRKRVIRSTSTPDFTDFHIVINRSISENAILKNHQSNIYFNERQKRTDKKGRQPSSIRNHVYFRALIFVNFNEPYTSPRNPRFYELLIYLVCFWNAVNMRFDEFVDPSIRLYIAGIVIGNATSHHRSLVTMGEKITNRDAALDAFSNFIKMNNPMPIGWDIAISQSNIPIIDDQPNSRNQVSGVAYIGPTCKNGSMWLFWSVALVLDGHDFSGIDLAAHEIGHLLGALHDGNDQSLCSDDGYIMSPIYRPYGVTSRSWSWCSRMEILKRISTQNCWKGTPSIRKNHLVPELLPGHIIGLHDQCVNQGYDALCDMNGTLCEELFCMSHIKKNECVHIGAPLPGTFCGQDMHCKHEVCVPRCEWNESI